jgi:hypothetical protein
VTADPTDADRATAEDLLQALTFDGHSWDGARELLATALADHRAAGFDAGWTAGQRQLVLDSLQDQQ